MTTPPMMSEREKLVDAVKSYIHWRNLAHTNPGMMLSFPSKEVRDECAMIMTNMENAFKRMKELVETGVRHDQ